MRQPWVEDCLDLGDSAVVISADSYLAWSAGGGMQKRVAVSSRARRTTVEFRDLLTQPQTLGQERIASKPEVKTYREAVSLIRGASFRHVARRAPKTIGSVGQGRP